MKNFIIELLDTLDQTGTDPAIQLSVLNLIQKHSPASTQEPEAPQAPGITKESIMAIPNPVERIQAIRANPTLFEAANTHNELENKFQD